MSLSFVSLTDSFPCPLYLSLPRLVVAASLNLLFDVIVGYSGVISSSPGLDLCFVDLASRDVLFR
jgi:hypothetical protein